MREGRSEGGIEEGGERERSKGLLKGERAKGEKEYVAKEGMNKKSIEGE